MLAFHHDVKAEVQAAYDWYNTQSEGLGEEYLKELDTAFELIETSPHTWPDFSGGFKRYLLKRFPFGIIYKPGKQKNYILAVAHLSREPEYWRKRK